MENINQLTDFLIKYTPTNINEYIAYYKTDNETLFAFLESNGFFKFHVTNTSKQIVYQHQIVAFFFCGGKQALQHKEACRYGITEINHFDGDTTNNSPDNLCYIPTEIHKLLTKYQRSIPKLKRFLKKHYIKPFHIWNKKGKPVLRFYDWLLHLFSKMVLRVFKSTLDYSQFFRWFKNTKAKFKYFKTISRIELFTQFFKKHNTKYLYVYS